MTGKVGSSCLKRSQHTLGTPSTPICPNQSDLSLSIQPLGIICGIYGLPYGVMKVNNVHSIGISVSDTLWHTEQEVLSQSYVVLVNLTTKDLLAHGSLRSAQYLRMIALNVYH